MPKLRRIPWWIWASLVLIGAILIAVLLRDYLFTREPRQLSMLARDWQALSFETALTGRHNTADHPAATNLTGAGVLGGQAQYITNGITGGRSEASQTVFKGGVQFTLEAVDVTVFDVSDWQWYVDCDPDASQYYVQLWSNKDGFVEFRYEPPLGDIPSQLAERIVYRSENPETLTLKPVAGEKCCRAESLPGIGLLANEPTLFGWNMRRGCRVSIHRVYDTRIGRQNGLSMRESCPTERTFAVPYDEKSDLESMLEYLVFSTLLGKPTLLLLPRSLEVHGDELGTIEDTGLDYLVLVNKTMSEGIVRLTAQPMDLDVSFTAYLISSEYDLEDPLAEIEPTTREVLLSGSLGKVSLGLETIATDELSEMELRFVDWPVFIWRNDVITTEAGEDRPQQFLAGKGTVGSAVLNGEELIPTRWGTLSQEVRGAIVGAIIAALVSLVVAAWETRRQMARAKAPADTHGPEVHVDVPPAKVTIVTATDELRRTSTVVYGQLLLMVSLAGILAWLLRRFRGSAQESAEEQHLVPIRGREE